MARTRLGILNVAPLLGFAAVGLATLGVSDPASRLPVAFMGVLGILGTVVIAGFHADRDRARFLRDVMLLGVAARFLTLMVIHQTVGPYVFAPDQLTYETWGSGLVAHYTQGAPFPYRLRESFQIGYPALNAVLFLVFGEAKVAPAVLNIFLSVWTAVPLYHVVHRLTRGRESTARLAAGLTLFFPSLVLWSTLNVREAPTIFIVMMAVYFFLRIQEHPDVPGLAGIAIFLGLLTLFREYLTALVGLAGAAGIVFGQSRAPLRSLAVGLALIFGLTFVAQSLGLGDSLVGEPSLHRAQVLRESFQIGAGSAYGEAADVSTPVGALLYLPTGLAYFLLAPFPWALESFLQAITLPETLIWWALVPFGLWGFLLALRRDAGRFTVPVSILVVVTFAYSLVESNVGTAYRHRGQILPLALIFCALGLQEFVSRRRAERARRARRRRRASEAVKAPFPPPAP